MTFDEEDREYLNNIVGRVNYQSHVIRQTIDALRQQNSDSIVRRLIYALRPTMFPRYEHVTLIRLRDDEIIPEPYIPAVELDDEIPIDAPPQFTPPKQNRRPA